MATLPGPSPCKYCLSSAMAVASWWVRRQQPSPNNHVTVANSCGPTLGKHSHVGDNDGGLAKQTCKSNSSLLRNNPT